MKPSSLPVWLVFDGEHLNVVRAPDPPSSWRSSKTSEDEMEVWKPELDPATDQRTGPCSCLDRSYHQHMWSDWLCLGVAENSLMSALWLPNRCKENGIEYSLETFPSYAKQLKEGEITLEEVAIDLKARFKII